MQLSKHIIIEMKIFEYIHFPCFFSLIFQFDNSSKLTTLYVTLYRVCTYTKLKSGRFWFNNCLQQLQLCSDSAINFFLLFFLSYHCLWLWWPLTSSSCGGSSSIDIHLDALLNHSGAGRGDGDGSQVEQKPRTSLCQQPFLSCHCCCFFLSFYWQSAQAFVASPCSSTPCPLPLPHSLSALALLSISLSIGSDLR